MSAHTDNERSEAAVDVQRLVRALQFKWNADIEKWTENAEALADKPEEAAYGARCRARAFEVRRCLNDLNSAFLANSQNKQP